MKLISFIFLALAFQCHGQCDFVKVIAEANGASAYFFTSSSPVISVDGLEIIIDRSEADSILIHLVVVSEFGCKTEADTLLLLEPCEVDVWIPNSFTPNGDGINDRFHPVTTLEYQMLIFNRWGEQIFSGNDWDGNYLGEIVPDGVYSWQIVFKKKVIYGRVTLLKNN